MRIKEIDVQKEWKTIKFEIHYNKPSIDKPYPKDIVNRRELLLLAQSFLADFYTAKSKKYKNFFGELYRKTMQIYFAW